MRPLEERKYGSFERGVQAIKYPKKEKKCSSSSHPHVGR
jgi:hypothetical protein